MVTGSSDVKVKAGYVENVVGFGWTNGVFLELEHALQPSRRPPWESGRPSR